MANPMKIRAKLEGDVAEVRVLMAHPMETGQRKDANGQVIPMHFIKDIRAELNGKPVFEAAISQAVSRNPVFAFKIKGAKAGDKLSITWVDNRGDTRTDSIELGS
ncbi:MAG: thiosulfate oxidation carrier complex protein SoxZ [Burkholderiales bacterium]|nr:thiosulfate oxidation carrier complex protein SoxZ [Burkholderiales bacterium]PZN02547.1 MAG: thiosulfate oxidation carrier complex protein SoxZ [Pseudomonadota bacterium]